MSSKTLANYSGTSSWRALTYYNLYRFLIAFLFVSLYWIGQLPEPLGIYDRNIFAIAAHFFLIISVAAIFLIQIRKPPFVYQVSSYVLLDILLIATFIYSSAGLNSGFGMLMVIAIAGGSILIPGKVGLFFAAVATISVLGHEIYIQFSLTRPAPNYIHAGFLGVTYFLTAFISQVLASRVTLSEALAEQRAIDLVNLAKLNENIVQRLQSGIIVLDDALRIRLYNESAKNLLGVDINLDNVEIEKIIPELVPSVQNWINDSGAGTFILKPIKGGMDIQVSLSSLNLENKMEILIFLDDVLKLRQQAQQLKLASLGRLTASIAHEVRNPLGAISHAGQLLSESDFLNKEEQRLSAIINEQSIRVNSIIENVMQISRRDQPVPSTINLHQWLEKFIEELKFRYQFDGSELKFDAVSENINVNMDSNQLSQIMWNICENGIRYSRRNPVLEIKCELQTDTQRPHIDIIDSGKGITPKIVDNLFEPFITTEVNGTGLGLFIARELCEANQATLNLYNNTENGCCFRINFSHPDRRQGIT